MSNHWYFLGATKHLYNWLSLLVGWLVGWLVGRVMHSFDDPHVAPYWPTWPCLMLNNMKRATWPKNGMAIKKDVFILIQEKLHWRHIAQAKAIHVKERNYLLALLVNQICMLKSWLPGPNLSIQAEIPSFRLKFQSTCSYPSFYVHCLNPSIGHQALWLGFRPQVFDFCLQT